MAAIRENDGRWWGGVLRIAAWSGAALLLALPLVAMRFTDEVNWGPLDFGIMGVLLFSSAWIVDRATRTANLAYMAGAIIAVGTGFVLIWVNLAVGIIGDEDNPANLMFLGVILIAALGSVVARFRAAGMARTMFAAAGAQALVAVATAIVGFGFNEPPGPAGMLALIGFFIVPWLISGGLFLRAALEQTAAAAD